MRVGTRLTAFALAGLVALVPMSTGHTHEGPAAHPGAATAFGEPGDPKAKARIVQVDMLDDGSMRFNPARLVIKQGETIRFNVRNRGVAVHELMLGTMKELEEHLELMQRFPDMEHDEPSAVTLDPGKNGVILWKFTKAGSFAYGCLKPGHYEAGMKGTIIVNR